MFSPVKLRRHLTLALFALALFLPTYLLAQNFRGGISGRVTDPSDAVVSDVSVKAINEDTGVSHVTITSSAGEYAFQDLPLGRYTVAMEAAGFQSTIVKAIQVSAGTIYSLPLRLNLQQGTTSVEVSASDLSLDTETIAQTTVLNSKTVQDLPINGRSFLQVIALAPGYAGYSNQAGGSLNGTRRNQVNYQIDGTDNNDPWQNFPAVNQNGVAGIAGTVLPIDAVEQFSLQTQSGAETGRNPGGTLNLVIKSGTNHLHGTAYYFIRNEALAAASPFLPLGLRKPENRSTNWGGSVGGPIFRDKTFYFLAFEKQTVNINPGAGSTEPNQAYQAAARALLAKYNLSDNPVSTALLANLWPAYALTGTSLNVPNFFSPDNETGYSYNGIGKLDHNLNSRNTVSLRIYAGEGNQIGPVGSYLKPYYEVAPIHVQNYSLVYNAVLRPTMTNQIQFGVSYFNQSFIDLQHNQNVQALGLVTGGRFSGSPNIAIGSFDQVGLTPPEGRNDITGHLDDVLSWNIGRHQLRFGGEYRQIHSDDFYFNNSLGTLSFSGSSGPWTAADGSTNIRALADFLIGRSSTSSIAVGNQERFTRMNIASGFAQDTYQATSQLNLTAGIRYDYVGPLYNRDQNLSIFVPAKGGIAFLGRGINSIYPKSFTNFSPRVGFTYQPRRFSNSVIRGGFGVFYDTPNLNSLLNNNGGNGTALGIGGNPGGTNPVSTISQTSTATIVSGQPFFPSANAPGTLVGLFSVDQNFRTPYDYNYYLQVEQALSPKAILQIGYVGNQARKLISLIDINRAALNPAIVTGGTQGVHGGSAGSTQQSTRPYYNQFPGFAAINQVSSIGTSNYNSLQSVLKFSSWHGITSQLVYTWSHNLDEMTQYRSGSVLPQDSFNFKGNYGNSDYDTRHTFISFISYDIPMLSRGPKLLTNGWQANSLLTFHGGQPFTVRTGSADNSGTGDKTQFAYQLAAPFAGVSHVFIPSITAGKPGSVQWINLAAYGPATAGTFGNQRRNQIFGPGYSDVDFSIFKNTPISERVTTQFRVELFNLFNRTNLGTPSATYSSGGYGLISSTIGASGSAPGIGPGEPFNTQLAFKLIF